MEFPRVVYALRHDPTGKVYVGSTHKIINRITNHINSLKHGSHAVEVMQRDYDKYGGPYTVFVLDTISGMNDTNKEYLWMDALRSRDPEYGYNVNDHKVKSAISEIAGITFPLDAGEERDAAKDLLRGAVKRFPEWRSKRIF